MALSNLLRSLLSRFSRRSYNRQTNHKYISKEVERAIKRGLRNGESIDKITKRILNVSNKSRNSAFTTAKTETHRIENLSRMDSFREAQKQGIALKKVWNHSGRQRNPRHWHEDMDGETVEMDELFSNGLEEPGDPNGDAREVINCACYVTAEIISF